MDIKDRIAVTIESQKYEENTTTLEGDGGLAAVITNNGDTVETQIVAANLNMHEVVFMLVTCLMESGADIVTILAECISVWKLKNANLN
ncbi:MAG: hypothetical protein ACTSYX_09480 [Candidatus Thorarchaeota archaeon]